MNDWTQTIILLLCSIVSAAVVPRIDTRTLGQLGTSDAGSADGGKPYSLEYLVPCDQCSADPENKTAQISFKVYPADIECGSSETLLLNDLTLPFADWHDPIRRHISFDAISSDQTTPVVNVLAYVQLRCLNGDTSILSLHVRSLDGIRVSDDAGFTVSFKQQAQARNVRYTASPLKNIDDHRITEEWTNSAFIGSLAQEFETLTSLELDINRLLDDYHKQQQLIKKIIIDEFKACNSFYCYLETAKERAPYLTALIKTLFCQQTTSYTNTGKSGQIPISPDSHSQHSKQQWYQSHAGHAEHDYHHVTPSHQTYSNNDNTFGTTANIYVHHQPSFARRHRLPIILFVIGTVLSLVLLFVVAKCVTGKLICCINPRLRRDFAARREERRTRAAYRRAACRQKVRQWWSKFQRPAPTSDYEEKRSRILTQENVLENVMQGEIAQLQRAHEIASDMIRAEEGRQTMFHEVNFGPQRSPNYVLNHANNVSDRNGGEASISRSISTLPLYSSPPPSYQSDMSGEMIVVDGFNYTPSNSDNTSESSVVDCTSRLSFDTDSTGLRE